jgi:hypothetical protein
MILKSKGFEPNDLILKDYVQLEQLLMVWHRERISSLLIEEMDEKITKK